MGPNERVMVKVHQSLTRPQLISGCDRELFLALCMICTYIIGPLGFIAFRPGIGIFGILLLIIGKYFLGQLAKKDPLARQIYSRNLQKQSFYPSVSSIDVPDKDEYKRWRA